MSGLDTIAQVAIGLARFSGVFVALTQHGKFDPADRFRLQFPLFASLGAMFLALLPYAIVARSWSEETAWGVLGWGVVAYTTLGTTFIARVGNLRRAYPDVFTVRAVGLCTLIVSAVLGRAGETRPRPSSGRGASYSTVRWTC